MKKLEKELRFYPEPLKICAGDITVRPLPDFDSIVAPELARADRDGWIYASSRSSRVFDLPKTHLIEHAKATGGEHLDFLVWALSFFVGMRLTTLGNAFLDATQVKPRKLVDFDLFGPDLMRAVELANSFWVDNRSEPRNAQRFEAAVHALFLSQYPQVLESERFIYLYTAIDACYALAKEVRPQMNPARRHAERIERMCEELRVKKPAWISFISAIRNNAMHEALFMDKPFGFAAPQSDAEAALTLGMIALVCRFLMALIGGNDPSYLGSPSDDKLQRSKVTLS